MPKFRVDDFSKSSTSTHLELDKNVVLDFGFSVTPSFSVVDSLPEVKFEKYEERLSQLESLVAENAALKKEPEAARARISQL
ncbi:hypothetical protein A0J61_10553 [Choanephora cucurbitarum]|uniref:Uncharacterized protein n=1 Tax=Choanephora cucurbitarum TaxID=101091 RepID=A0A1C7MXA3_9FUNG|nr:hypothetical protein A0J61_10553 [Choanephora cucurbitarum]